MIASSVAHLYKRARVDAPHTYELGADGGVRWVNAITMRPVFKMCSNINDVTLTKGKTANHSTEIAIPFGWVCCYVDGGIPCLPPLRAAFAPSFCTTMSTMGARR